MNEKHKRLSSYEIDKLYFIKIIKKTIPNVHTLFSTFPSFERLIIVIHENLDITKDFS